jgi:hypothetical protein
VARPCTSARRSPRHRPGELLRSRTDAAIAGGVDAVERERAIALEELARQWRGFRSELLVSSLHWQVDFDRV